MPREHGRSPVDHRKEARLPAQGIVEIQQENLAAEIVGDLRDISASGFRAVFSHEALVKGQTVKFRHSAASGQARVVWNCIRSDSVETGFLIV